MNNRMIYVTLLFVTLLIYGGCTSASPNADDYRYGSQGLELRFHSSNAYEFFEGEDVNMLIDLKNRGTADIIGGQLFVSGYDPSYFDFRFIPGDIFSIKGKDEFNPSGELGDLLTLEAPFVRMPQNQDEFSQSVKVTACYDYRTVATAEVCVDPDPFGRRVGDKVCQLGATNYGAQGHPVAISSIIPRVNSEDIRFEIRFSNQGNGDVFDLQRVSYPECARGLDYNEIDVVYVSNVRLGERALFCEPLNPVRMAGGSGYIVCTCQNCINQEQPAYWSVLHVEMDYGYRNSIQRDFTVYAN